MAKELETFISELDEETDVDPSAAYLAVITGDGLMKAKPENLGIGVPAGVITTYREVFEFDNTTIKASPTTPLTLVPAPGANQLIVFQGADIITDFGAGVYSNVYASGHSFIAYGDGVFYYAASVDARNDAGESLTGHDQFWKQELAAAPVFWQFQPNFGEFNTSGYGAQPNSPLPSTYIYNQGLVFRVNNNSANFTGGNAANTLKIAVKWDVWDLS